MHSRSVSLWKRLYSAKEPFNLKEPANRSHPLRHALTVYEWVTHMNESWILSLLYSSFAKETYNFKEPTNRSHPLRHALTVCEWVTHMNESWILSLLYGSFAKETYNHVDMHLCVLIRIYTCTHINCIISHIRMSRLISYHILEWVVDSF